MYAGSESADQCFCGNSIDGLDRALNCDEECVGNDEQTCGGSWALQVYKTGN